MRDFASLMRDWPWQAIRDCPGRFVLRAGRDDIGPAELLGTTAALREYITTATRDPVVVARFAGGGLISYRHRDGRFTHTLNTPDGLARKLGQFGITHDDDAGAG